MFTIEFIEDNTGELTRQALDEGLQAVDVALGPDGVKALVEERNTAQAEKRALEARVRALETEIKLTAPRSEMMARAVQRNEELEAKLADTTRFANMFARKWKSICDERDGLYVRVAELKERLAEANARADIWEKNYTNCDSDPLNEYRKRAEQAEAELAGANSAIKAHVALMSEANTRAERQTRRADSYARTAQAVLRDAGPALVEARERAENAEAQLATETKRWLTAVDEGIQLKAQLADARQERDSAENKMQMFAELNEKAEARATEVEREADDAVDLLTEKWREAEAQAATLLGRVEGIVKSLDEQSRLSSMAATPDDTQAAINEADRVAELLRAALAPKENGEGVKE